MRDPRYRFSNDVRAATRAIAARMTYAKDVAETPEALAAWIARTDDLRETLTHGGYRSEFDADDLFPLFQAFVAKATAATPDRTAVRPLKWMWIAGIAAVVAIVIGVLLVLS